MPPANGWTLGEALRPFNMHSVKRPFLIGLAGGTCSGKSTLARALRDTLGANRCTIFPVDSYYIVPNPSLITQGRANFDSPHVFDLGLCKANLDVVLKSESVDIPSYDKHTGTHKGVRSIIPTEIVVVEGLFALWDADIRHCLNLKVYVDVDDDVRLARRFIRDVVGYGFNPEEVCEYYLQVTREMHKQYVEPTKEYATLILKWPMSLQEQVSAILEKISND